MATALIGSHSWRMKRTEKGHRNYTLRTRVQSSTTDGPANVSQTPGLPLPYAWWIISGDSDTWAWCKWDMDIKPDVDEEPNTLWTVEQLFTTEPPSGSCRKNQVEDPLLEPQKISGNFSKYVEEATKDRFEVYLQNSAYEQIRGPAVEFDKNRASIKIVQNVPQLQLGLCTSMIDTVNQYALWGLNPRQIKLSNFSWERKFYGTCSIYFTRTFDFEIRYASGDTFDKDVLDEGTKVLGGPNSKWTLPTIGAQWQLDLIAGQLPSPGNPAQFRRAIDASGNPIRVPLNGCGVPTYRGPFQPGSLANANLSGFGVLALPGNGYNSLFWSVPAGTVGDITYNLYRGFTSGGEALYKQGLTEDFFTDSPLANGSPVYYFVTYIDDNGESKRSVEFYATPTNTPAPYPIPEAGFQGNNHVEKYAESDFTQLGIPTDLESLN